MPLTKGISKKAIRKNTSKLIHEGYPAKQAYAIANNVAKRNRKRRKK